MRPSRATATATTDGRSDADAAAAGIGACSSIRPRLAGGAAARKNPIFDFG